MDRTDLLIDAPHPTIQAVYIASFKSLLADSLVLLAPHKWEVNLSHLLPLYLLGGKCASPDREGPPNIEESPSDPVDEDPLRAFSLFP